MLAALHVLNCSFGLLFAVQVLRADPKRRENRLLALATLLDVAMMAGAALVLVAGHTYTDPPYLWICLVGRVLVVHPILEFTYAFPFDERPPVFVRRLGLGATVVALGFALHPETTEWFGGRGSVVFFVPYFVLTSAILLKNLRRLRGRSDSWGVRVVLFAVAFRFGIELVTYHVVRPFFPGAFPSLLLFDDTAAVMLMYLVVTYAVLRHRLFRVGAFAAEAVFYTLLSVAIFAALVHAVEELLEHLPHGPLLRASLVLLSLVPVVALLLIRRLWRRVETAILDPLDPPRAQRRATLERVLRESAALVEPAPLLGLTLGALGEVTRATGARFLPGPEYPGVREGGADLPVPLVEHFTQTSTLWAFPDAPASKENVPASSVEVALAALNGNLVLPVRAGSRVFGALVLNGGAVDRETLGTAVALADNLASKLGQYALFHQAYRLGRELEESKRLATLGAFAAAIAHDLRTPLTSVQMNVQMLRARPELGAGEQESCEIALSELRRMSSHITEILDYAKPVQLQAMEVDLREIVDDAVRQVEMLTLTAGRGLEIVTEVHGAVGAVRVDAERMRQVLLNLLDNAVNASPDGARILLRARRVAAGVAIEVVDTGRGIEAEHLPKIFEPFFTTRPDGTGLGLAIVNKLVRAHGGEVSVVSESGHGATFTVVLPASRAASLPQ